MSVRFAECKNRLDFVDLQNRLDTKDNAVRGSLSIADAFLGFCNACCMGGNEILHLRIHRYRQQPARTRAPHGS